MRGKIAKRLRADAQHATPAGFPNVRYAMAPNGAVFLTACVRRTYQTFKRRYKGGPFHQPFVQGGEKRWRAS